MVDDLRTIGEMARASGLTVSALRFYDGAGVLVPAVVDPVTGYRRYADDQLTAARLVAGLRRVGMPMARIAEVLAQTDDVAAVRRVLDNHERRLEDALADARRELARLHALLDPEVVPMPPRATLPAADLAVAIDSVRLAVGADAECLRSAARSLRLWTTSGWPRPAVERDDEVREVAVLAFGRTAPRHSWPARTTAGLQAPCGSASTGSTCCRRWTLALSLADQPSPPPGCKPCCRH